MFWADGLAWITNEAAAGLEPPAVGDTTDSVDHERVFASRKAHAMARLEAHGIPLTWVDAWVDWWQARDAKNDRHHPGFWEQAVRHIAGEWDEGRTVPPAADAPSEERNKIR